MRTPDFLYVEYHDGEREFYDLRTDPFELHNLAPTMTLVQLDQLQQRHRRRQVVQLEWVVRRS